MRQIIDRVRPPLAPLRAPPLFPGIAALGELNILDGWREPRPAPLGQLDSLDVVLAQRPKDIRRAQELRYRVFYEEMAAIAVYVRAWRAATSMPSMQSATICSCATTSLWSSAYG